MSTVPPSTSGGRPLARFASRAGYALGLLVAATLLARAVAVAVLRPRLAAAVVAFEAKHGRLDPDSLAPPEVPPLENAARYYRAALDLTVASPAERKALAGLLRDPARVAASPALADLVRHNEMSLELVTRARTLPRANWGIRYRDGFRLPDLMAYTTLGNVLAVAAMADARDGRAERAAGRLAEMAAFNHSLGLEPFLIVQLIHMAGERGLALATREVLATSEPGDQSLRALDDALAPFDALAPAALGLRNEFLRRHAFFRNFEGEGSPLDAERAALSPGIAWLLRPVAFSIHRRVLGFNARVLDAAQLPGYARGPLEAFEPSNWAVDSDLNVSDILAREDRYAARVLITRTAVALRRYRVDCGRYPESLGNLLPDWLAAVPVDPFTGKPLEYSCDGQGFRLASAGARQPLEWDTSGADQLLDWRLP